MGLTAIVKPTHDCNLKCRYCYVDENAERGVMNENTLVSTIEKVTLFSGSEKRLKSTEGEPKTHFIWHGGEPLLMGTDFFRKIVEIEKPLRERGYEITNGIQTNGTLVTDEFLDFVEEQHDFNMGLSLDGPKYIHDAMRIYPDGRGSFEEVMRAIELIKRRDSKRMGAGVIAILTKRSIGQMDEIYRFFKENKIQCKVNPLIKSGRATASYDELAITPREYGDAMSHLFKVWFYDKDDAIDVDPFSLIIGNLLTGVPHGCNYNVACQKGFVSIGPTGAAYPCGRFDGVAEFYLGNINDSTMEEIDGHPLREKLKKRGDAIKECRPCGYKKVCNSGCMHNAYMITGDPMTKDYYCQGDKMLFKCIETEVDRELGKAVVG